MVALLGTLMVTILIFALVHPNGMLSMYENLKSANARSLQFFQFSDMTFKFCTESNCDLNAGENIFRMTSKGRDLTGIFGKPSEQKPIPRKRTKNTDMAAILEKLDYMDKKLTQMKLNSKCKLLIQ